MMENKNGTMANEFEGSFTQYSTIPIFHNSNFFDFKGG